MSKAVPRALRLLAAGLVGAGLLAAQGPPDTEPPDSVPPLPRPSRAPTPSAPSGRLVAPRPGVDTALGAPRPGSVLQEATGDDLAVSRADLDGARWQPWWALHEAGFLDLRARVWRPGEGPELEAFLLGHGERPGWVAEPRPDAAALAAARAALRAAAEEPVDSVLLAEVLLALGRLGDDDGARALAGEHLGHAARGVAERAVLALGLGGGERAVPRLAALVRGDAEGGGLADRERVPLRVRALAAWSLGLAGRGAVVDVVQFARRALLDALARDGTASPDLAVGCLGGLAELGPPPRADASAGPTASREAWVEALLETWRSSDVRLLVRAHVPRTLARAVEGPEDEALRARIVTELVAVALPRSGAPRELRTALALALGRLVDADGDALDRGAREVLVELAGDSDLCVRHLALVGLGRVAARPGRTAPVGLGRAPVEAFLRGRLLRGKSRTRPWAALALGVLAHEARGAGGPPLEKATLRALRAELSGCRTPQDVGAFALALGLARDAEAAPGLVEALERFEEDAARVHLALALGLLGDRRALEPLRGLADGAQHRPALLESAAVGAALLGDERAVPALLEELDEASSGAVRVALTGALARVGDSRALASLARLLGDPGATSRERAAAARALGGVGERTRLPWSASLSDGLNYPALVDTLMAADGSGLLNQR